MSETTAENAERQSALFAQLVSQQAGLALMLLGKTPHPETGQVMRDLESAGLFIDQLEMLAAKTKGNLSQPEEALLKQSLMSLRLAFVEVAAAPAPATAPIPENKTAPVTDTGAAEVESKKRFSKKFSL